MTPEQVDRQRGGTERVYGWCHTCRKSIGVAMTDKESRLLDLSHQDELRTHATSWAGERYGSDADRSGEQP